MVGNEVVIRKACEADFEFILEANAAVSEKGSNTVLKDTERLKKDLIRKNGPGGGNYCRGRGAGRGHGFVCDDLFCQ